MDALRRTAAFLALTLGLLIGALFFTSRVQVKGRPLLGYFTHTLHEPGGWGHSLQRYRDAEAAAERVSEESVDIVVLGSSHGYRGFDPRVFDKHGLHMLNLSSTVQTPLNAFYLGEHYLPRLKPKTVVVEVYYHVLSSDGLESYRDLVVNLPPSPELTSMAFATRNMGAVLFVTAKRQRWIADESNASQKDIPGETYVAGGYVETTTTRPYLPHGDPIEVTIRPEQLDWLVDLSALAASHGARVVWVTHPLPSDHLARTPHYDDYHRTIAEAADRAGVAYWDFNRGELARRYPLDSLNDFADFNHLNANGVRTFNEALVDELKGR